MNPIYFLKLPLLACIVASGVHAQNSSENRQQEQRDEQQQRQDQQQKAQEREQQQQQANAQSRRSEASKQELKVDDSEAKKEVTDVNKASKIIGMKVINKQNEDLGRVKDLVVDFESGKIAYAVLSAGGTLGVGGRLVAVPIESLTPMVGQKAFLVDADKNRISQAAGFSDDDWPKIDAATESSVGLSPTGRPSEPRPKDR